MTTATVKLEDAVRIHQTMVAYRNDTYINLIQQINTKAAAVLKDDMGSQFLQNCGRDIAGEIVRNYFDASAFNITVDQLAARILKFKYDDEYDPLSENGSNSEIRKSVYNFNESHSSELNNIVSSLDDAQEQLFSEDRSTDRLDAQGKKAYRESQLDENGDLYDELTDKKGTKSEVKQNGKTVLKSNLHADHIQSRESGTYNSRYITEDGIEALKAFWNSADNMQLIHASANTSKGDVRVCEVNGKVTYNGGSEWRNMQDEVDSSGKPTGNKIDSNGNVVKDISHRATPEQLAQAIIQQWEKGDADSPKIQTLINEGYLQQDEAGNITVPKAVRKALERNIRHSQNAESKVILENTDYKKVGKDAADYTKAAVGKILAGQIIYYAAPPLVYEIRCMLKDKKANLDNILIRLGKAAGRIGDYVLSKLKDIFQNVLINSLKKFIKSFMDILINMVKATVKKLMKIAKNLAVSAVDAIRIIAEPSASLAEKADSVVNLFGVTITNCVIEVLFELLEKSLKIPEILLTPLQILTSVVCTNLTMLILQKADLFDVRFGFKINAMKQIFQDDYEKFDKEMQVAENFANAQIDQIIESAREETRSIYEQLQTLDPKHSSVRSKLQSINSLFSIQIDYDDAWRKFIKSEPETPVYETASDFSYRLDYKHDREGGLAAIALIQYFRYHDPYIVETVNPHRLLMASNTEKDVRAILNSPLFTFGDVCTHLDRTSKNTVCDLSVMIDEIMKAGRGPTVSKLTAKKRFDDYCESRGS